MIRTGIRQAGNLDQYLVIEHETKVNDTGGGYTHTWAEFAAVWGNAKSVRSDEIRSAGNRDVRTVIFTFYRRSDLTADMRIVWEGRHFEIEDIRDNGPRYDFMTVVATSGLDKS